MCYVMFLVEGPFIIFMFFIQNFIDVEFYE